MMLILTFCQWNHQRDRDFHSLRPGEIEPREANPRLGEKGDADDEERLETRFVLDRILPPAVWVEVNSRKSVRWSAVPVPCLSRLWLKLRGEQGSGPEGVDDLCFHTYGEFSPPSCPHPPSPSLQAHISAWRPISQPPGPNPSLEAQIP